MGMRLFLDACAEPEVERIILLDAPAVLGWEARRDLAARYALGLVQAALQAAIEADAIIPQPVVPLAHVLIGALDECALYVARAEDPDVARQECTAILDRILRSITPDGPIAPSAGRGRSERSPARCIGHAVGSRDPFGHADEVAGHNDPVRGKCQRDRSASDQGDQLLPRAFPRLARHWIEHGDIGVLHNLLGLHIVPIDVTFRDHRNNVARPQISKMEEGISRSDVMRCHREISRLTGKLGACHVARAAR